MATTDTSHLPFDILVVTPLSYLVNDYDAVIRARAFEERGACGGRDARLLAEADKRRRRAWADAALYAVARLSVVSEPGGAVQAFGDLSERAFYCSVLNALNRCLTAYRGEIDDFVVTHQGDDGRIQDAALDARAPPRCAPSSPRPRRPSNACRAWPTAPRPAAMEATRHERRHPESRHFRRPRRKLDPRLDRGLLGLRERTLALRSRDGIEDWPQFAGDDGDQDPPSGKTNTQIPPQAG